MTIGAVVTVTTSDRQTFTGRVAMVSPDRVIVVAECGQLALWRDRIVSVR